MFLLTFMLSTQCQVNPKLPSLNLYVTVRCNPTPHRIPFTAHYVPTPYLASLYENPLHKILYSTQAS